jgi:hypothetical protein
MGEDGKPVWGSVFFATLETKDDFEEVTELQG